MIKNPTDTTDHLLVEENKLLVKENKRQRAAGAISTVAIVGLLGAYHLQSKGEMNDMRNLLTHEINSTCMAVEDVFTADGYLAASLLARELFEDPRGTIVTVDSNSGQISLGRASERREPARYTPGGTHVASFITSITFSKNADGNSITFATGSEAETTLPDETSEFHGSVGMTKRFASSTDESAAAVGAIEAAAATNDPARLAASFAEALDPHAVSGAQTGVFNPTEVIISDSGGSDTLTIGTCRTDEVSRKALLSHITQSTKFSDYVGEALDAQPVG